MKTIEKFAHLSSLRGGLLTLMILAILLPATGCTPPSDEKPADTIWTEATSAQYLPEWAPAGTNREVRYYYLPAAEVYYDAYVGQFVYYNGVQWVYSLSLPSAYAHIELSTTPIVFLSIGVMRPWIRHTHYVSHYPHRIPPGWAKHGKHGHGHHWHYYDENRTHRFATDVHRYPNQKGRDAQKGNPNVMTKASPKSGPAHRNSPSEIWKPRPGSGKSLGGQSFGKSTEKAKPKVWNPGSQAGSPAAERPQGGQKMPSRTQPSGGKGKGGKGSKAI